MKGLLWRFHRVVSPGVFDEDISAPVVALRIAVPRATVPGRDQREAESGVVRLVRGLAVDVRRHALHVFHERHRGLEDVMVDPLDDVTDGSAALVEDGAVGVVNVTAAVGAGVDELAVDLKLLRY